MFMLAAALALPAFAHAESYKEKAGAQDYPLVSRYKGSVLANYGVINFEHVDVPVGPEKNEAVEGKIFNYYYVAPKGSTDLEVYRNYKAALEQARFKVLLACEDAPRCEKQDLIRHANSWTAKPTTFFGGYSSMSLMDDNGNYPPRFLAARLERPEGNVTVVLTVRRPSSAQVDRGAGAPYFLQVIETAPMEGGKVTVNSDAIGKALSAEGKIALYGIYFDTGKAELKPESRPQLDEMAKLLNRQKNLKVYIVGHTDNQGSMESNLALSQKRADAVIQSLARDYRIDARRLAARGVASLSPVASNGSDAGRAKNRRVEMVEQ